MFDDKLEQFEKKKKNFINYLIKITKIINFLRQNIYDALRKIYTERED